MNQKILVAMSGGVDSGMTAALLKEAGYTLHGVTMQLYCGASNDTVCGSKKDAQDAAALAKALGFSHEIISFTDAFQTQVIDRFAHGYACGETPNPCIACNRYMKFCKLWEYAKSMGFDGIATGHYARVERDAATGRYLLKKSTDLSKDQTYVLYHLSQEQLAHICFPLGTYYKTEVREMAVARQLSVASKPDSQDICFVPDGDYAAFLERYTGQKAALGQFLDTHGQVIGTHRGHVHYTVGQRKGLGIGFGKPMYVIAKDAVRNTVTLGEQADLPVNALLADDVNWIAFDQLQAPQTFSVKTRYHQPETVATVIPYGDTARVEFAQPKVAAPGQAVVFYDGDTVVGGGTIRQLIR